MRVCAVEESRTIHSKLGVGTSNDRAPDRVRTKRSVSPNPSTPRDQTLAQPLGQSLPPQLFLVERENRVNPGGSQRWDQARDYGNHNKEQSCSRYAYGVRGTDMV